MHRIAFVIAFLALLAQATGYFAYGARGAESCSQPCPDDDEQGRCPPDCGWCNCCTHVQPVIAVSLAAPLRIPSFPLSFDDHGSVLTSLDGTDIFHVPKSASA